MFKNHLLYSHTSAISLTALLGLALGKQTKQSSTYQSYRAEYAVDGNRGTDFYQDKCTHTDPVDTNPWWRVDLLTVYSIKSVRILNRGIDSGGDFSNRLRDVTVTVGLTESDVNTPCGVFAGPGTASQLVVINCPTSPQGRFVMISKTTSVLTLCEVDVFVSNNKSPYGIRTREVRIKSPPLYSFGYGEG
uniref:Fucolectin n=1 Tax=Magallana gigas TaxID=29159 RepID=K1QSY7_MAGGI